MAIQVTEHIRGVWGAAHCGIRLDGEAKSAPPRHPACATPVRLGAAR